MSQVEKLSYENNRNKQEFIDIAEKVQAINKITKLDSTMQKRLATMEDKFNLWLEDREQKKEQEQQLKQQVKRLQNTITRTTGIRTEKKKRKTAKQHQYY